MSMNVLRVFVGSPGDLGPERSKIPAILETVNEECARAKGFEFEAVGWEDTLPGHGRPQELINKDLLTADVAVMLLWKRWGTATGTFSSGFYEEFNICMENEIPILLYLKDIPVAFRQDPGPQLTEVLQFRKKLEEDQNLLYAKFSELENLDAHLRKHLSKWLEDFMLKNENPGTFATPQQWLRHLAADAERSAALAASIGSFSQMAMRISLMLSDEAVNRVAAGHLERAEEVYHAALDVMPIPPAIAGYCNLLVIDGRVDEAQRLFIDTFGQSPSADDQTEMWYQAAKACIAEAEGKIGAAEVAYRRLLDLSRQEHEPDQEITALMHLGCIERDRSAVESGTKLLEECIMLSEKNNPNALPEALNHVTDCYVRLNRSADAVAANNRAYELAQEFGQPLEILLSQFRRASLLFWGNRLDEAEKMYDHVIATSRKQGHPALEAIALTEQGTLYMSQDKQDQVLSNFEAAMLAAQSRGRPNLVAMAGANLGQVLAKMGRTEEGLKHLMSAQATFGELGYPEAERVAEMIAKVKSAS